MSFKIPPELVIYESNHWVVNHRVDTDFPGYLMVGARKGIGELCVDALSEMGFVLGKTMGCVEELLNPKRLFCSRYGYDSGHSVHFHVIPIFSWVEEEFLRDSSYSKLCCDGSSLTLFLWREYIEASVKRPILGPSVSDVVESLRARFEIPAEG